MKWILILLYVGYKSSTITNIEFDSLPACEHALKAVKADFKSWNGSDPKVICVPKDKD